MVKCYQKNYPRPQFVREQWKNLNGPWDFAFDDKNVGEAEKWYEDFRGDRIIQVPFVYQTKASGIDDRSCHNNIWYGRTVYIGEEELEGKLYLLHFEGSDYLTKVWINGCFAGVHRGAYARFSFDLTKLVHPGENDLVVKVEDSADMQQPRGKQRWVDQPYECYYLETTGIWKTVWTESVPEIYMTGVKMTPDVMNEALELEYSISTLEEGLSVEAEITCGGILVSRTRTALLANPQREKPNVFLPSADGLHWGVRLWSPKTPNLYDVTFRLLRGERVLDEVGSYFAMREIKIEGKDILLNGHPLYQRLILDQGYWKDTHLTPPCEEDLVEDIEKIQQLGYNGLRKHQKTEDERFLYWCDVKGMLVWGEMASAYRYTDNAVQAFAQEWMDVVRQNYNHPCIITWTPLNESWGIRQVKDHRGQQHFTEAVYHLTKSVDPNRPVIVNDGWEHTVSDIITLHDYTAEGAGMKKRYLQQMNQILEENASYNTERKAFAVGYGYQGQPVMMSEFGGIAFDNDDSGWGYGNKVSTEAEFLRRFEGLTKAVKEIPYFCGYCYTQATDVQQEINGLMDMDRNFKVAPEKVAAINLEETYGIF